jgi:hypothetical protein
MPGVAKAAIVFATATLVSWGVSASLRSLSSAYGRLPQPAPQQ